MNVAISRICVCSFCPSNPQRRSPILKEKRSRFLRALGSDEQIIGLETEYCDSFQCNSSPQVERAVRAFAKDLERASTWTIPIFAEDVQYKVGGLGGMTARGKVSYRDLRWNQENMEGYRTSVNKMTMVDNENAEIEWTWKGSFRSYEIAADVKSKIYLNVLTGRIMEHEDHIQLRGNLLGQMLYTLSKWAWAQRFSARQVSQSVDKALDRMSMDESQEQPYVQDPTDPTRFTQSPNSTFDDGVLFATFLLIMWTMWQAYTLLVPLGF